MRRDQDDYDPLRDQYAEHDTRDDGAGLVLWMVIAAGVTLGFGIGMVVSKLIFG